jgi:hypothetical protein
MTGKALTNNQVAPLAPDVQEFRCSYVSMVALLLVALFLSPFAMFGISLLMSLFFKDFETPVMIGMSVTIGLLALIPAWYLRLRVWLRSDSITRRTLFGTIIVPLNRSARFKNWTLRIGTPHLHGAGAFIDAIASESAHMRYFLAVENEGKIIKLGSTLKNVQRIANFLHQYELDHVLPLLGGLMASGQIVDSGAIRQNTREIHLGRKVITKPLSQPCAINGPTLTLHYTDRKPRQVVVKLKNVWNPYSTQALLSR